MKSPGIPEKADMVKQIREKQIPIISEIEFAYRYKGDSKFFVLPVVMEKLRLPV